MIRSTDSIREKTQTLLRTRLELYAAVSLKANGGRLNTAFKLESDFDTKKWFYYEYLIDAAGKLTLA